MDVLRMHRVYANTCICEMLYFPEY